MNAGTAELSGKGTFSDPLACQALLWYSVRRGSSEWAPSISAASEFCVALACGGGEVTHVLSWQFPWTTASSWSYRWGVWRSSPSLLSPRLSPGQLGWAIMVPIQEDLPLGSSLSSLLTALNTALLLPINQPVKDLFKVSELQKGLLISRTNKTTRMFVLFFQSFQSLVSSVGKFLVGGSCTDRCNNGSWEPKIWARTLWFEYGLSTLRLMRHLHCPLSGHKTTCTTSSFCQQKDHH